MIGILNWRRLCTWLKLNKLFLNVKKTKSVNFSRKQKQIAAITLSINGEDIENVEHFNFLGIILDEKLSWINHINMLSNKISKVIKEIYLGNYISENIYDRSLKQTVCAFNAKSNQIISDFSMLDYLWSIAKYFNSYIRKLEDEAVYTLQYYYPIIKGFMLNVIFS